MCLKKFAVNSFSRRNALASVILQLVSQCYASVLQKNPTQPKASNKHGLQQQNHIKYPQIVNIMSEIFCLTHSFFVQHQLLSALYKLICNILEVEPKTCSCTQAGHREVILPTFVEHKAAFLGRHFLCHILLQNTRFSAEGNLTLLYFLGEPGNVFLIINTSQSQNSLIFSTVHFNILKMKPSAVT